MEFAAATAAVVSAVPNGQNVQPPATENPNKVKKTNKQKRVSKKRKAPGKKTPNKAPKRARGKNKGLQPSLPVDSLTTVNSSNHGSVLTNVSKGRKKARQKPKKKDNKKVVSVKQKRKPAKAGKAVSDSNLDVSTDNPTDDFFGKKSGEGLHCPREGDYTSDVGQLGGIESAFFNQKVAHDSYRDSEKKPQTEVAEQHVPVGKQVLRLINWEHFGLIFEEYCMCTEVSMSKK